MQKQQVDIGFLALCALCLTSWGAYFAAAAVHGFDANALAFFKETATGLTFVVLALFRSNPPQIHYVTAADAPPPAPAPLGTSATNPTT